MREVHIPTILASRAIQARSIRVDIVGTRNLNILLRVPLIERTIEIFKMPITLQAYESLLTEPNE